MTRRVALITGASRGIGAATAKLLGERGFRVAVNYRASAAEVEQVKLDNELHSAFLVTKAIAPGMVSHGNGRLVYMTAVLSRRPRQRMIALGTDKAALDQLVRYVALELAPHGITANLVAPATVQGTTMTRQLTAEQIDQLGAATPMGRPVRPDHVAEAVAYLASDGAGSTTGHCIPVSGGVSMD